MAVDCADGDGWTVSERVVANVAAPDVLGVYTGGGNSVGVVGLTILSVSLLGAKMDGGNDSDVGTEGIMQLGPVPLHIGVEGNVSDLLIGGGEDAGGLEIAALPVEAETGPSDDGC